jgi:GNAT superfamily N-acetyltransferase
MLVIRDATKRDFAKLVEIMNKSTAEDELQGFVPPASETRKFLVQLRRQLGLTEHRVFVAEVNHEPVGFVYFVRGKGFFAVEELDVVKRLQGQGIGKALVKRVEELAERESVAYLTAGTAINREGKPWRAYGFWLRMGYLDTGERTDSGCGFKYCKLVKKLKQRT